MRLLYFLILIFQSLLHLALALDNAWPQLFPFQWQPRYFDLEPVSFPMAAIWGMAGMGWLNIASEYINRRSSWWIAALASLFISQCLYLLYWQDAALFTFLNVVILIGIVNGIGHWRFERQYEGAIESLLSQSPQKEGLANLTMADCAHLPEAIKRWMKRCGVIGRPPAQWVKLSQTGEMCTGRGQRWMPFRAQQVFTIDQPGFVWCVVVEPSSGFQLTGIDQFMKGTGSMHIALQSLMKVVDAQGPEIDQGTMLRYLAEICWFPAAALHPAISWQGIDDHSAIATFEWQGRTVQGTFRFNTEGDLLSFEADRYYQQRNGSTLEKWMITATAYEQFNGLRLVSAADVTWKLAEGDFKWLSLNILEIQYQPA
jgi:hypothetical protein